MKFSTIVILMKESKGQRNTATNKPFNTSLNWCFDNMGCLTNGCIYSRTVKNSQKKKYDLTNRETWSHKETSRS